MELSAVVVVPADVDTAIEPVFAGPVRTGSETGALSFVRSPRTPVLGHDVMRLWIDRVKALGVGDLWLASASNDCQFLHGRLRNLAREGIEKILVIKLKSYAEMDLADLLRFHREKRNPVTSAHDARGALGVSLLNRCAFDGSSNADAACAPGEPSAAYQFNGYTKRLLSSRERQDLVRDALTGGCAMRPAGQEVRDQVWVAADAVLDHTARIVGPAFMGSRTVVHAGATIGPFASVECDCVVDCGTCVEQSSVLPNTYLAPGLLIRQSIVNGHQLEHLELQAVVDLAPARLGRKIRQSNYFKHFPFGKRSTSNSDLHRTEWRSDFPSSASAEFPLWQRVNL